MRRRAGLAVLVLVLVWLPAPAAAAIRLTLTGAEVTAEYEEPSANADQSPLQDLSHTNVYYQIPGQPPVKTPNIAAVGNPTGTPARTPAMGGGQIRTTVTVPLTAGQEADVTFWATATDRSGNESARSTEVVQRIDRLPPAPPQ